MNNPFYNIPNFTWEIVFIGSIKNKQIPKAMEIFNKIVSEE